MQGRAVHRREFSSAQDLLGEAHALNARICSTLQGLEDIYWTGYVQDAQKELVEACATYALIKGEALPDPCALGIAPAAFLNGLAESVGELVHLVEFHAGADERRLGLNQRQFGLCPLCRRMRKPSRIWLRAY